LNGNQSTRSFSSPVVTDVNIPISIGQWRFVASDAFTFENDDLDSAVAIGQPKTTQYNNLAAASLTRNFGKSLVTFGAQRTDKFSPTDPDLEETVDQFSFTPGFIIRDNYTLFWRTTYGLVYLADPKLQDSEGISSEIGVAGQITPYLNGTVSVGYAHSHLKSVVIEKPGDLAGLLTNLEPNDVLFIDEIHRLSTVVEEYLYSAMEDYRIDIMIDTGPNARSIQINLNPFTLIGATTRSGLLTAPLLSRFGIKSRLEYHDAETLKRIIQRSAGILNTKITSDATAEIARRSRGTPRIANSLLRRVRDFAQVLSNGIVDLAITQHALHALNVDEHGLDEMDNRILSCIIDKFKGGPVGITTIATAVGEETGTLEEVYEPFLIQEGFIMRTPRGREVTQKAYEHLGRKSPGREGEQLLF